MSDVEDFAREIVALKRQIEALKTAEYNRVNVLYVTDGITAPGTSTGWAKIYVDTADGDLKVKFSDGVTKTITTDT